MEKTQQSIKQVALHELEDINIAVEMLGHGEFVLLSQNTSKCNLAPHDKAASMRLKVRAVLNQDMIKRTGHEFDLKVGYSIITPDPALSLPHSMYKAICDAKAMADNAPSPSKIGLAGEFARLITEPGIFSHYQPILNLSSGDILGWEALCRCPEDSPFESPSLLFDFAEETSSLFALEEVCRQTAIKGVGLLNPNQKLFINIHPKTIVDPNFQPGKTLELLNIYGLCPTNIVFEITERYPVKDFNAFHSALDHYRSQGYLVAIDDVGTGYSGLWTIAKTQPDFIKIDMSLIRGIDTNPIKRSLLEAMLSFAEKIGCRLIAEGIETERELSSLITMGVHYGQGFHICRPNFPKPLPKNDIINRIAIMNMNKGKFHIKCSMPIEALVESAPTVDTTERVWNVKRLLETKAPIGGVVVLDGERPVGLVMSYHLDRKLGSQYGIPLYAKRPVTQVMDTSPLIVDSLTPVEKIAKDAMARERYKIYDHIIVIKNKKYYGIVSVQNMLDTLAKLNIEIAKGANPLTGLPGNMAIEQEIESRIGDKKAFSVIYVDLDNFKAYNDLYGFKKGDQIILLTARILTWAIKKYGSPRDFVGHIGGDDFVVIMNSVNVELYCEKVVRCFKRAILGCFSHQDIQKGYLRAKDRDGQEKNFPLTSISIGVVNCIGECSLTDIAKRAAEIKKYAKTIAGNCWVVDRRSPLGGLH
ncbi:MAG: GGDEF domain-containing protein [Dissulfurimicrobium sp.]|uniref:GGDEF domain-containing protein n=1 Tax=Dissulfurimicrobium sp. TaxID=2022436 RepID=UPI00404ABDFD